MHHLFEKMLAMYSDIAHRMFKYIYHVCLKNSMLHWKMFIEYLEKYSLYTQKMLITYLEKAKPV